MPSSQVAGFYYDKGSPSGYYQPGSCYLLAQRSEHADSEPSILPMKRIMMSIGFALAALLLSLACAGGALHLERSELWAHGLAKADTAPSSPDSSDSQQTEAGDRPSTNTTGLLQFLPHGVCFLWDESLLLLHVVSDSVIALAYYSIPIALIFFVRRRKDLAFSWIFVLFAVFIVACGTTHLLGIWTIWHPAYWLDGTVKAITATVSLVTAILLWPLIPKALALPSPAQLRSAYQELEERNRLIEKASRMKSEFLANMSHELRTPLNGIIGFTELMHDGKLGPVAANHQEYLGDVLSSAKHLLGLINDILDLSKVETGKFEFRPESLKLSTIIGEVKDIIRAMAVKKQISIKIEIDSAVDDVFVDAAKLKQVLYNYLSNAVKFTHDGGRIVVRAVADDEGQFRIEVEDNGIGISAGDMDRLFVEFQQLDSSSAKKYPGTGLGLALTKRIVEAQGGRVGAQSTAGHGSVFYAILPKNADPAVKLMAKSETPGRDLFAES
jgi:signal transduction histidine kinase